MNNNEHFTLTDHCCRYCGGRVIKSTAVASGGGNPLWLCADCERGSADTGPDCICWCGYSPRGSVENPYICSRFEKGSQREYYGEPAIKIGRLPIGVLRRFERQKEEYEG